MAEVRVRTLAVNICLVVQVDSYISGLSNNLPTPISDLTLAFGHCRPCGDQFSGVNKSLLFHLPFSELSKPILSPLCHATVPYLHLLLPF